MSLDTKTKSAFFTRFRRGIRDVAIQNGFKPQRDRSFAKKVNDVVWSIAPYRIPMSDCDDLSVQLEFGILSPSLLVLTSPDWTELGYLRAQIRATYHDFLKKGVGESGVFCISNEADLSEAIEMANEIIVQHGLPFITRIDSTEGVLDAYFNDEYNRFIRFSHSRCRYEKLAWQGEIDPKQVRFIDWQRTQPDAMPKTLVLVFNFLASSEEEALSLRDAIEEMGYLFSYRKIDPGWLCSARRLTDSYNPKKKSLDAMQGFAAEHGVEYWSCSVGSRHIDEEP